MDIEKKYIHQEDVHNLKAPREIVPEILKIFTPESVVDIGCGIGTFLYCFKEHGINHVLGIDGPWVNKKLLKKYLTEGEFREGNIEKELDFEEYFDLVISLEVAEHLSAESAEVFIRNLVSCGEIILFSAAIPHQGGQNHINEQWLTYWEDKFSKHDYVIHDILRPIFWNNPRIFSWYKQNMVLVTPKNFNFDKELVYNPIRNVVHYDLFLKKATAYNKFVNGESPLWFYLKCLIKSLINWSHIKKKF